MTRALFVLLLVSAAACAPAARAPDRPRPVPPVSAPAADPLSAPWVVQRTGATHHHRIEVTATLETRVDTVTALDTVRSELDATWSEPSIGWPRRWIGSVDGYRVAAGGDSLAAVADHPLPLSFTAVQPTGAQQPEFTTPDASSCAPSAGGLVQGLRDLWLSVPDTLRAGSTWRDSTSYTLCRDSIPLEVTVVRRFEIVGATRLGDEGIVATIARRTSTVLRGAGQQFGEPVTVEGHGEGTMMFELALTGARVRGASGDAVLTLTLRGSRRVQELTQRSRTEILER